MKEIVKLVTYRKLETYEKIKPSDLHSLDEGSSLLTIFNSETIGHCPTDFIKDRSFWRVQSIAPVESVSGKEMGMRLAIEAHLNPFIDRQVAHDMLLKSVSR